MDVDQGVAISLFSGAGGLDLGVEASGVRIAAAVELNGDAADTMEKNAPRHFLGLREVLRKDLAPLAGGLGNGLRTKDILRAAGIRGRERPELVVGGPPCVAFSKSGFWLDWKRAGLDPAASLLQAFTRVVAEARPHAFILENVYALTFKNKASSAAFARLIHEVAAAGYQHSWRVLNAADYGVPQLRPRLFVIGTRPGVPPPDFPEPTHHGRWERRAAGGGPSRHVTAGDALEGVLAPPEPEEELRGRWAGLVPEIPPGQNYLHFTAERGHPQPLFEWRSRYWSFLLKLDARRPSPTIQARPGPNVGPFHWDNRRLRVAELARLFTFPDGFDFVGSRGSVQYQIGNAVPPLLAKRVAEQLHPST